MQNWDKFQDEIIELINNGRRIAVDKTTMSPRQCAGLNCKRDCLFGNLEDGCSTEEFRKWCHSEYVQPCPFQEGELVEVSDDGVVWSLRYFIKAGRDQYLCYIVDSTGKQIHDPVYWKYCRKYGTLGGLVKENGEKND